MAGTSLLFPPSTAGVQIFLVSRDQWKTGTCVNMADSAMEEELYFSSVETVSFASMMWEKRYEPYRFGGISRFSRELENSGPTHCIPKAFCPATLGKIWLLNLTNCLYNLSWYQSFFMMDPQVKLHFKI